VDAAHTKKSLINITVDHRERNNRLLRILKRADGVRLEKGNLKTGDYRLNNLTVERKTISDLVSSIKEGRLFLQASRLLKIEDPVLIILEGTLRDLQRSGMKRQAIQGALITIALRYKIPVLRSIAPEETALLMLYSVRQIDKRTAFVLQSGRKRITGKNIPIELKNQLCMLHGIQGIGQQRALLLLKKFGSLSKLFNASIEELSEIPGFGEVCAKKIYDTLHKDVSGII
jgi:DNA excision repair protein ERCC-4